MIAISKYSMGIGDRFGLEGSAQLRAFAAARDRGLSFAEAMRRGVVAGSLACAKPGAQTSMPTAAEIEEAIGR